MSGAKGRSGRPRLPVELHLARGTFRPDRHGPRPEVNGTAALQPEVSPPPDVLKGLGPAGTAFVRETWATFDGWTPPKILLLRKAGELTDAETRLGPAATGEHARLWLAVHRSLLATLRDLGLEDRC